jgi:small ligand-binding sensory domain FIST
MRWASAALAGIDTQSVVRDAVDEVERRLDRARVDLLFAFATPHHQRLAAAIPALLRQRFPGAAVVGGLGPGVLGDGAEIEDGPGFSILAGHLPDVEARVFHVDALPADIGADGWRALVGVDPLADPGIVLLADPGALGEARALAALDRAYPHGPKLGALVSGAEPGTAALFADGFVHRRGIVGVALTGDVQLRVAVAQGARPVGPGLVVTDGSGNLVRGLDGRPAFEVLGEVFAGLSGADQAAFRAAPIVGIGAAGALAAEDLLVRNVVGVHPPTGGVAVAHPIEVGQELRFFVRDADSARADLRERLARVGSGQSDAAALLFPCVGRGRRFFGEPDHDSRGLRAAWGDLPTAGLFSGGEIGPVRGQTHLHAFTAAAGWLGPRDWA